MLFLHLDLYVNPNFCLNLHARGINCSDKVILTNYIEKAVYGRLYTSTLNSYRILLYPA